MKKLIYFVALLALTSCGVSKKEDTQQISGSADDIEVSEEANTPAFRPVYRETETVLTDLIHTKLEVNFDWAKSRMNGTATITAKQCHESTDDVSA